MGLIGIEGTIVPVRARSGAGDCGVIDEMELFFAPLHADDRAGLKALQNVFAAFFRHGGTALHGPASRGEGFDESEDAPEFVELICPFPLEAVVRGDGKTVFRTGQAPVKAAEHSIAGVPEGGGVRRGGGALPGFEEPRRFFGPADGVPQLLGRARYPAKRASASSRILYW